ncbi:hypothetical protein [Hyalangium rubrum]|uniref:Uncharacterized protein n=1 Tax=Hyalangium rubrum TaxID=3103134 RepID=A0ABU5H4S0_9BACT|nr:hypothetical protein [Hyalangium sp. s54d21]MDY7228488.1 hypothetical protein [Hyalangium sp. s54d21]
MNSRLLLAFLCVASLSTGCIIVDDDHPPARRGDVTFMWTFAGLRCDGARDVYGVNIQIPGESLHNGGQYGCNTNNVDGIVLHDFVPGTYNFQIQAVDYRNVVIFEGSGSFVINGDARVNIDMVPVGNSNNSSYAYLTWTLPGNKLCNQAGITTVEITLDDLPPENFPCFRGQELPGLQTPYLAPGEHYIDFIAKDSTGRPLYYFRGSLSTQAYNPVSANYHLTSGGAAISWRFSDGSVTYDCLQADGSPGFRVGLNFRDVFTNELVYGEEGDWQVCSSKPITYSFLRPGTYKVILIATTSNGIQYRSNPNIPNLVVQADQFPGPNQALEVTLFRQ